ncbi:MAG: hypothetical protein KAX09_09085 [Candidatus Heimdallarchaeota archaeon]|nr:hypothetical protein [Candidatus Heimdallarchaeota archaeon]MCK4291124.1 hypothetical protein [Candidatus Heimdallarchaeota archaeon]
MPDRMKTVKVVVPNDYSRNLLRFISSYKDIDIIDVQKKPFDITTFDNGQKIKDLSDDFDKVIEEFKIEYKVGKPKKITIHDEELGVVLKEAEKISKDIILKLKQLNDRLNLAEQELEKNKSVIQIAQNLIPFGFSFEDLDDERPYFTVMVGKIDTKRVPRFKWNLDAITDSNYVLKESKIQDKQSFIAIGFLERYQDDINRLLIAYDFEKMSIPERISGDPDKVVAKSKATIKKLEKTIIEFKEEANQIIKENSHLILGYGEQLDIEEEYLKISNIMRCTKQTTTFWAWIPDKKKKKFEKGVALATDDAAIVEISEPVFEESEYPTKTSVPKFMRVYDGLVNAYGTPGYNEFNSAIILQIFFPITFGIMFADVGHGFLFMLIGFYGLSLRNKKLDLSGFGGEIKNYFKNGSMLIIVSGLCAMVFGVLYGSYFGVTHHAASFVPEPIWFSPEGHDLYNGASSVILMLELSLVIGMAHMTIGYVLRFIRNIREKHFTEAILVTVMWTIFHWTLFILVFTFGTNFMTWFSADLSGTFDLALFSINGLAIQFFTINGALWLFLFGMVVPVVVMSGYLLIAHKLDGLAELLEILLSTLSNTVSYARIFAMNAVHGALSHIFTLQDFTPGDSMGVVNYIGVAIGSLVILAIEGLFSFIQTLRLQWVEYFSKVGYQGQGFKFQPIAIERRYTQIIRK